MGWIAAAAVFLGFLFKFPKWTLIISAGLIGLGLIGSLIAWRYLDRFAIPPSKIDLLAIYDPYEKCTPANPIFLGIKNNSSKKITVLRGNIKPRRRGYSVTYRPGSSFSMNRIIPPGGMAKECLYIGAVAGHFSEHRFDMILEATVSTASSK